MNYIKKIICISMSFVLLLTCTIFNVSANDNLFTRIETENYSLEIPNNPYEFIEMNCKKCCSNDSTSTNVIKLRLPFENELAHLKPTSTQDGTIIYKKESSTESNVEYALKPTECGFQNIIQINNATAPNEYKFDLVLPSGYYLVTSAEYLGAEFDTKEVFVIDNNNIISGVFSPAWAKDANGQSINTYYKVQGNSLIQVIDFDKNTAFPVVADPDWGKILKCSGSIAWVLGSAMFAGAKLIKIKKYIQALGGVSTAASASWRN